MIVHLNGMPGVGKLTIARELSKLVPLRLIDNHLMVDLAESVCDRGPLYQAMHKNLTQVVYDFVARAPSPEIAVFTNALAKEIPEDAAGLEAVRDLADRMSVPFVPILLECTLAENQLRLIEPERSTKRKLMNPDVLKDIFHHYTIAHYPDHPNALEIDVTKLMPVQAATLIAKHLGKVLPLTSMLH